MCRVTCWLYFGVMLVTCCLCDKKTDIELHNYGGRGQSSTVSFSDKELFLLNILFIHYIDKYEALYLILFDFILCWCTLFYQTETKISSFCNASGFNIWFQSLVNVAFQFLITDKAGQSFVQLKFCHSCYWQKIVKQFLFFLCTYLSRRFDMFDPPVKSWQEDFFITPFFLYFQSFQW